MKKVFHLILIFSIGLLFSACSGKYTSVQSYQNGVLSPNKIREVNLETKASAELEQNILKSIPIRVMGDTLLELNQNSPITIRITEHTPEIFNNPFMTTKKEYLHTSKNEKEAQYYYYNEYCMDTTYVIKATLEVFEYEKLIRTNLFDKRFTDRKCYNNRDYIYNLEMSNYRDRQQYNKYNNKNTTVVIINNNNNDRRIHNSINRFQNIQPLPIDYFYNNMAYSLSQDIISYIAPTISQYKVYFEEDFDVKITGDEEKQYEKLIELAQKQTSPDLENSLLLFINKYNNSYTFNYNIGVYYEKSNEYDLALFYYKKALEIKYTEAVSYRLNTIENQINIRKNLDK